MDTALTRTSQNNTSNLILLKLDINLGLLVFLIGYYRAFLTKPPKLPSIVH